MACLGSSSITLSTANLLQGEPIDLILGEKRRFKLNIYQDKDNAVVVTSCPTLNDIVVPTTLTVTNEVVNIYNTSDFTTVLVTGVPVKVDILDSLLQKQGVQLSYVVDTTAVGLNVVGSYAMVFSFDIDAIETRMIPIYFDIVALSPAAFGGC